MIRTVFRHFFTGKDNQSFEVMRALTALSVLVMLVYTGVHLVLHGEFDPMGSASGLGVLLFGGAAGAAVKDGSFGGPKINAGPEGVVNVSAGDEK